MVFFYEMFRALLLFVLTEATKGLAVFPQINAKQKDTFAGTSLCLIKSGPRHERTCPQCFRYGKILISLHIYCSYRQWTAFSRDEAEDKNTCFKSKCLEDYCFQNFNLGRYTVGYTVGSFVLRLRVYDNVPSQNEKRFTNTGADWRSG